MSNNHFEFNMLKTEYLIPTCYPLPEYPPSPQTPVLLPVFLHLSNRHYSIYPDAQGLSLMTLSLKCVRLSLHPHPLLQSRLSFPNNQTVFDNTCQNTHAILCKTHSELSIALGLNPSLGWDSPTSPAAATSEISAHTTAPSLPG